MLEKRIPPIITKSLFIILALLCFSPLIDPPKALFIGILFSILLGHPFLKYNSKITKKLLQYSVVGLGFGLNATEALEAGQKGFVFTLFSIVLTLVLGWLIGKWFNISKNTSTLISSGTAICGGSAIAAVSPIIKAKENEISVALASVFILNSLALFIFPIIGHWLHMSQADFGLWAAIAIHDTSSVVGAAQKYGDEALKIATTIKLQRALWIIPLSLFFVLMNKKEKVKINIPYFIFFFILAMLINTFVPQIGSFNHHIVFLAKKGLTLTLFLIGTGLSLKALKSVGIKPLLQAVLLWVFISILSLWVILEV
ncbi:YeiH family protein [Riemerella anatipestifer]|uniref:YeiH family protein n=1 Tax=Riemerella anatipestifer TaxID=34085 RepID=UPI0030BF7C8D